jgi:hypothetical protein
VVPTHALRTSSILLLATALAVAPAPAQQIALRELPKPSREIDEPFSFVTGAVEFKGGQLIVADGTEGTLSVVDFARGTRTALGRQGSGPGEYRTPAGIFRLHGDTIWVLDAAQMRMVAFNPDLTPGTGFPFITFDQQTSTALTAPYFMDPRGRLYASAMAIQAGRAGGNASMVIPDSVAVVRVDPRDKTARLELTRVRFPTSGKPEMKQQGNAFKYTMAFPGLVASDPWTVFPDGRIAILRGSTYTVEYIGTDGKHTSPVRIAYEHIKVTEADRKAEMDEAKRRMVEQGKAVQKMMPANITIDFELTPPEKWPDEYPAVSPLGAIAAPDGRLWAKRGTPIRLGREQWDVIDPSGKLVARWQLPAKVTLVAVGQNVVYTVRTDEDDLRYVQRVEIPR